MYKSITMGIHCTFVNFTSTCKCHAVSAIKSIKCPHKNRPVRLPCMRDKHSCMLYYGMFKQCMYIVLWHMYFFNGTCGHICKQNIKLTCIRVHVIRPGTSVKGTSYTCCTACLFVYGGRVHKFKWADYYFRCRCRYYMYIYTCTFVHKGVNYWGLSEQQIAVPLPFCFLVMMHAVGGPW